jgi:ADP-ribose pyrophosphatase YjhB (NUDIX family)
VKTPKEYVLDGATGVWRRMPARLRRSVIHGINDRFPVGVVGLIADPLDRVLLLEHRFRTPYPWGLPGGFMGFGETFADALKRELREELDLEADVAPEPFDTELVVGGRYLSITMLAHAAPKALVFEGELTNGGFFGPGELPVGTYPPQAAVVEKWWASRPALQR